MAKVSIKQLEKKVESLINKRATLEAKKEKCVNDQNELEDTFEGESLSCSAKYNRLVDLDFELADKILEVERELKNARVRLNRAIKKEAVL